MTLTIVSRSAPSTRVSVTESSSGEGFFFFGRTSEGRIRMRSGSRLLLAFGSSGSASPSATSGFGEEPSAPGTSST
jgi:hypothetical protein